mmetsp:Transcript_6324/g.14919  ORF Transcript_6324/g.14919 Transcript_6324/m.14919 type:complete len:248 (+) Transcript_6324:60-803(+)
MRFAMERPSSSATAPAPAPAPAPKSGSVPTPLDISVGSKPTASSAVPMTPPEAGNWPAPPASAPPSAARVALDDSMTEDERQDEILRSFGLTKASERSEKAAAEAAAKGPKVNAQGQWSEEPAFIAEDGGINFLALIPAPLQGPIESFLYTSTGVLLSAFIVAGLAITVDAYYVSVKEPLPDTLANLIVDVIEPNFTNAGLAFLASSVSLGLFKIAQFSNPAIQYSEDFASRNEEGTSKPKDPDSMW